MTSPLDLHDDYLLIDGTDLERLSGGPGFWDQLLFDDAFRDQVGAGWLVAAFEVTSDWESWEMHPDADEVVHVTSGRLVVTLDRDGEHQRLTVHAHQTVIVPAGVWHTVDVVKPGGTLHLTHGQGTEHRPR